MRDISPAAAFREFTLDIPGEEVERWSSRSSRKSSRTCRNWLVQHVDQSVETFLGHGGELLAAPFDIPVGRAAVVRDFGNALVLVDLSKGVYTTGAAGTVTGVDPDVTL